MDEKTELNVWYALIALVAIVAIQRWWAESQRVETDASFISRARM